MSVARRASPAARGGQREPHELADVQRALDRDRIADPADGGVLVAGGEVAGRDVGDEGEVHVQALAAGGVLLVADQAWGRAVDAEPGREDTVLARLLAQLAPRGLEWCLARLELAPDRQPEIEALVAHQQDLLGVAAKHRHRKRASVRLAPIDGERARVRGVHVSVSAATPG